MTTNIDKLKNRDYVLVIDRSGSMTSKDTPSGQSRWDYCKESTLALTRKLNEFDPDGINVLFFNDRFKRYDNVTPEKVEGMFAEQDAMGGTTLAPVLNDVFNDYSKRKAAGNTKANGEILLVITDGQPQDEATVASSIVNFTKKLDNGDGEYGISFIQVGRDSSAASFLKKLDDDLEKQGAKFDIVDTVTMDDMADRSLISVIESALVD